MDHLKKMLMTASAGVSLSQLAEGWVGAASVINVIESVDSRGRATRPATASFFSTCPRCLTTGRYSRILAADRSAKQSCPVSATAL